MSFGDNPDNPFRNLRFPNRGEGAPRKIGTLPITIAILAVLAVVLVSLSGFYVDLLWFRSVDYSSVWSTMVVTKIALFFVFGLLTSAIIMANVIIAYKRRPIYVPITVEADNLERYRKQIEPLKKVGTIGLSLALIYFAGSAGTRFWESWMLYSNATSFGAKDPQFGKDISFFMFTLPFWQALVGWAISTLVLATVASVVVH